MSSRWLLYGAYGYTGRLLAGEAARRGLTPVLAGRDGERLHAVAEPLGLERVRVDLQDAAGLRSALSGVDAVLHAAGPFSRTWRPMAEACLDAGTHYLDVTGEVDVFEALHSLDGEARRAGIVLLPGVGFDVVPSDCAAVRAAEKVDRPTHLELALHTTGRPSRGTARTMVEGLGKGARERRDGEIVEIVYGAVRAEIPFEDGGRTAVAVPWGDVSTAYHSTGISNVRVYMTLPRRALRGARWAGRLRPLLGLGPVQALMKWWVDRTMDGPAPEERAARRSRIRCRVWSEETGEEAAVELTTPGGYAVTAESGVAAVGALLAPGYAGPAAGFLTPTLAFGAGFVDTLSGVRWERP